MGEVNQRSDDIRYHSSPDGEELGVAGGVKEEEAEGQRISQ